MKKTNLRINNCFLFEDKDKYYLTDIDILDDWSKTSDEDLSEYVKKYNDITKEINELMKKYQNFIVAI